MNNNITYHIAQSKEDFDACKEIISEYLETLGIYLAYMDVAKEFSSTVNFLTADVVMDTDIFF
ncbi:MAG TPA: hypothetical protein VN040_06765 [Pseudosphingobacterium sp.]|nr:hypothetical protein [Pseudosphingobacterium sp.]